MTNRNYNTENGKPYVRANQVVIAYNTDPEKFVEVNISESMAIVADGKTYSNLTKTESISKTLTATQLATESFPLINPATGAATGQTMTLLALAQAITSYVRVIQNEKDLLGA
jgi:hypothetical protein